MGLPRRTGFEGLRDTSLYAGKTPFSGYSIVSAESLDSAVELAKGCPVLEIGDAVDVYEGIAM